ncbi:type VI secretion system protein TssA [Pseudomonas sp. S 311-6]|uniref:type VI secretion system protein TssA n=1 Tax=Pseudomonas TaxID=286 RepID=UPI002096D6CA|nr:MULTISPECIES: type VI secretion system protein TssA [Pseudomonas]MCO7563959.1 type VI secretion system protein TssA [Pseudomonas mosselii]MCO7615542.1 type VI secretion system protein TssA [Pseudomonas guariconensis]MCO7637537.1 type VI secretion system protein TssA [Pseudomonas sp. S 311-6]
MSLQGLISTCLDGQDAVALAKAQAARWEPWLAPVSPASPVGEDPGYDDDFQHMREEVNKLSGANVERVIGLAEQSLKQRCKDLRIATYYLWARTQRDGEAGLADGLELLAALLERFTEQVLPTRPNSRRMALEWVASGKVLDGLSLFPEVVKAEAQRTVAALAWLERIVSAWPQGERPGLRALYAALAARLTQSGGVNALVPQNSAVQSEPTPHMATPVVSSISSGRDLLDSGKALASYLRDQPQGWLAAHRLLTSLRWDTVHQPPPQEANGNTRLVPPRTEYRAQLKRLYLQQSWTELLDQVERMYAEGVNHFWLDLQWYLCKSLSKLGVPYAGWADIVKRDLGMFLDRLPGIEQLRWNDGTPFADEPTRDWIMQHVSCNQPAAWMSTPVAASSTTDDILALEGEALAQADSNGVEAALAWLAARPDVNSGRQRWLLRLLMARVSEQYGKSDLAIHLLGELDSVAQQQQLTAWEPELGFEVKARLLKLLRQKAQRNDVDKTALARRMEGLLAALVAADPVRAAVLCG